MAKYMTRSILVTLMLAVRSADAATLDETIAPGHNFDKAEFRLWSPDASASVDRDR